MADEKTHAQRAQGYAYHFIGVGTPSAVFRKEVGEALVLRRRVIAALVAVVLAAVVGGAWVLREAWTWLSRTGAWKPLRGV